MFSGINADQVLLVELFLIIKEKLGVFEVEYEKPPTLVDFSRCDFHYSRTTIFRTCESLRFVPQYHARKDIRHTIAWFFQNGRH